MTFGIDGCTAVRAFPSDLTLADAIHTRSLVQASDSITGIWNVTMVSQPSGFTVAMSATTGAMTTVHTIAGIIHITETAAVTRFALAYTVYTGTVHTGETFAGIFFFAARRYEGHHNGKQYCTGI
jgi:hypothetical protein